MANAGRSFEEIELGVALTEAHITSRRVCIFAGIALLVLGVLCSLWILALINGLFRSPDRVALIGKMVTLSAAEQGIRGQVFGNDFAVTYNNFLVYFVLLIICGILLSSAGRIIAAFLASGVEALAIAAGWHAAEGQAGKRRTARDTVLTGVYARGHS